MKRTLAEPRLHERDSVVPDGAVVGDGQRLEDWPRDETCSSVAAQQFEH
jgi:hypothetical protein